MNRTFFIIIHSFNQQIRGSSSVEKLPLMEID